MFDDTSSMTKATLRNVAEKIVAERYDEMAQEAQADRKVATDEDLALLDFDLMEPRLYGSVFEIWLNAWREELDEGDNGNFDCAFSEKNIAMAKWLLRAHFAGETPLSLADTVSVILKPGKRDQIFRTRCNQERKKRLEPMSAIGLCRLENQGTRYDIEPGDTIEFFFEMVVKPLRKKQMLDYMAAHISPTDLDFLTHAVESRSKEPV